MLLVLFGVINPAFETIHISIFGCIKLNLCIYFHSTAVNPSTESNRNNSDLTKIEMKKFVEKFRQRRIEMGLQQAEVGRALRRIYGNGLSQATVCRFEAMKHSLPSMNKLKRILEDWLKRTEAGQFEDASSQSSSNESNMENVDPAENAIQINPRKDELDPSESS